MDIGNAPALWNVLQRKPALVGVAAENLAGRLRHRLNVEGVSGLVILGASVTFAST